MNNNNTGSGVRDASSGSSRWPEMLIRMDSVASTQEEAKALAEQGAPEGTAVMAEEQTAGRGRMGRKWHSPRGKGIWMSVVLRPELPLHAAPQLTLLAGAAVCSAIRRAAGVEAGIKWPNDLMAGGRKICGILLESGVNAGRVEYCIAGIGIDANLEEDDYPQWLREVGTSLKIQRGGAEVDRGLLAAAVLDELSGLYRLYLEEGFERVRARWESMSVTVGRRIALNTPEGRREGLALGLDGSGGLVLADEAGQRFTVTSGEIEMI